MATGLTVRSDRVARGIVTLQNSGGTEFTNLDGDQDIECTLPSGFGDCLILYCALGVVSIATMVANPEVLGIRWQLSQVGATSPTYEVLGESRWTKYSATAVSSTLVLPVERASYWAANESLRIRFAEVDTNATPTADGGLLVKVRRLRGITAVLNEEEVRAQIARSRLGE